MTKFRLKRVYDPPDAGDGTRILVDRLWPRGIWKDKAMIGVWLKDIAPNDRLPRRFHGHPDEWDAFREASFVELTAVTLRAAAMLVVEHLRHGPVTLLYAARDVQRNNAITLGKWLDQRAGGR